MSINFIGSRITTIYISTIKSKSSWIRTWTAEGISNGGSESRMSIDFIGSKI